MGTICSTRAEHWPEGTFPCWGAEWRAEWVGRHSWFLSHMVNLLLLPLLSESSSKKVEQEMPHLKTHGKFGYRPQNLQEREGTLCLLTFLLEQSPQLQEELWCCSPSELIPIPFPQGQFPSNIYAPWILLKINSPNYFLSSWYFFLPPVVK